VLKKCRDWAGEVGELKITDEQNPVISIQVTGVDIEPIVKGAEGHDNTGNRRRKIREMLFAELGIPESNELFTRFSFWWRGTLRDVEVLYENVRELADDRLRGREGRGRLFWISRLTSPTGRRPTTLHAWIAIPAKVRKHWSGCPPSSPKRHRRILGAWWCSTTS
jgi:hypothetical protein